MDLKAPKVFRVRGLKALRVFKEIKAPKVFRDVKALRVLVLRGRKVCKVSPEVLKDLRVFKELKESKVVKALRESKEQMVHRAYLTFLLLLALHLSRAISASVLLQQELSSFQIPRSRREMSSAYITILGRQLPSPLV